MRSTFLSRGIGINILWPILDSNYFAKNSWSQELAIRNDPSLLKSVRFFLLSFVYITFQIGIKFNLIYDFDNNIDNDFISFIYWWLENESVF